MMLWVIEAIVGAYVQCSSLSAERAMKRKREKIRNRRVVINSGDWIADEDVH